MSIETLLNQLDKVTHKGGGRYMARCCAHEDRSPSLAIKEDADGTILLHCFAGCSAEEIIGAAGLEMGDLFPKTDQHSFYDGPPARPRRETRGEANLAEIQVRHLTAEAMVEGGHRLSDSEKKTARDDFKFLKDAGKLP